MDTDGSQSRELELGLERTLPVSRATVYEALTDSTKLATWWRPTGFTVPNASFEPRAVCAARDRLDQFLRRGERA